MKRAKACGRGCNLGAQESSPTRRLVVGRLGRGEVGRAGRCNLRPISRSNMGCTGECGWRMRAHRFWCLHAGRRGFSGELVCAPGARLAVEGSCRERGDQLLAGVASCLRWESWGPAFIARHRDDLLPAPFENRNLRTVGAALLQAAPASSRAPVAPRPTACISSRITHVVGLAERQGFVREGSATGGNRILDLGRYPSCWRM